MIGQVEVLPLKWTWASLGILTHFQGMVGQMDNVDNEKRTNEPDTRS